MKTLYKNWPAISRIPDLRLRTALALLDMSTDFGMGFASCLRNFFTENRTIGPYPLSAIIEEARSHVGVETNRQIHPVFDGVMLDKDIPLVRFVTSKHVEPAHDNVILPEGLGTLICRGAPLRFGQMFDWEGSKLTLVDIGSDLHGGLEYDFAPAELISVDCKIRTNFQPDKCPSCEGRGGSGSDSECNECHGVGKVPWGWKGQGSVPEMR